MIQTPSTQIAITPAVTTSSTAVDISVPATDGARWTRSLSAARWRHWPAPSARERINLVAELLDVISSRERRLLFAHARGMAFTSRTRGFVQHVV
jgi:hypothetical protein